MAKKASKQTAPVTPAACSPNNLKATAPRAGHSKVKEVWLKPEILTWDVSIEASSVNSRTEWVRAHELWLHADRRLKQSATRDDRADVVGILRRVLNHRLKNLKMIYLENIPTMKKPAGTIEQLAFFGIVKPLMLHRLLKIRNAIEYQDSKPPSVRQCAELLEVIWYFLRSTDILVRFAPETLSITKLNKTGHETPYGFSISTGPRNKWNHQIAGWFEPKMVSIRPNSNWLKTEIEMIHTKQEWLAGREDTHPDKNDDDIWIIGKLVSTPDLEKVCHLYFAHAVNG